MTALGDIASMVVVRRWWLGLAGALLACDSSVDTTSLTTDGGPIASARVLRVTRVGSGSGYVFSDPPGIDCSPRCEAELEDGVSVELFAEPSPGSRFLGWSGDCAGHEPTCAVLMSASRAVTAQFVGFRTDAGASNDGGPVDVGPVDAGAVDGGDGGLDGGVLDGG